jgi:hypothetical protein
MVEDDYFIYEPAMDFRCWHLKELIPDMPKVIYPDGQGEKGK